MRLNRRFVNVGLAASLVALRDLPRRLRRRRHGQDRTGCCP